MKLMSLALAAAAILVAGCSSAPEAMPPQQQARCVPVDAPTGSNIAVRRTVCKETASQDAGAPVKR